MIVAAARARFDRPYPVIDKLVSASFVVYLFHMPVVIALGLMALFLSWPPMVECVLITGVTLLSTYALSLTVERQQVLNFVFNGVMPGWRAKPAHAQSA